MNKYKHWTEVGGTHCTYCKRELNNIDNDMLMATLDHVTPACMGGRLKVWACRQCNLMKGNLDIDEWEDFMHENPEWLSMPLKSGVSNKRKTKTPAFYEKRTSYFVHCTQPLLPPEWIKIL